MGCSASLNESLPSRSSRKQNSLKMDQLGPDLSDKETTPRNWTSPEHNLQFVLKKRKQLEGRKLFVDPQFPPRVASIGTKQLRHSNKKIVWVRPHELSSRPILISDGPGHHGVKQGDLNNSWFLSTLSLVAERPQLMSKIIPDDNSFDSPGYAGSFHCCFWQFGQWVDVHIDDMLPTLDGKLLFARSLNPDEFWVALVEKAYAKLNKSYAALEYGFEAEAYTDLTGGLAEWYVPSYLKENDFYIIRAAYQCGAVIECMSAERRGLASCEIQETASNHTYVVTAVEEIPYNDRAAKLIRLRNPCGNTEWDGEWCNGGDEWKRVPEAVKKDLEMSAQEDGECWMSFSDFKKKYFNMIICNVSPDFDHDGISDKAECQLQFKGRWEKGHNSGGWLECSTFSTNPQYHLVVHYDTHVQQRYGGRLPLVVSLLQVYRRGNTNCPEDDDLYAIGFEIFQLSDQPTSPLGPNFFQTVDPLMPENEETYAKYRETSGRFFLDPGDYLLVPSTHEVERSRDYLLRLFSVGKIECTYVGNMMSSSI